MFLKEFEGSSLFKKHGIAVPDSVLLNAGTLENPRALNRVLNSFIKQIEKKRSGKRECGGRENFGQYVVKAQLLKGGRGKKGLVVFADKTNLAGRIRTITKKAPGSEILIQEKVDFVKEFYLAVMLDRDKKCPKLIFSRKGGVDIEQIIADDPDAVEEMDFDLGSHESRREMSESRRRGAPRGQPEVSESPVRENSLMKFFESVLNTKDVGSLKFRGLLGKESGNYGRESEKRAGAKLIKGLADTAQKLLNVFENEDAILAEINPLAVTPEGVIEAVDAKVIIDDNALFRHGEFFKERFRELSGMEAAAKEEDLSYVELDGDIAIVGNGAGLVMATLDSLKIMGGRPANFCDIGGGASGEMMAAAISTVLRKENIRALLINIFGGITRCDEVARGIAVYFRANNQRVPVIARITGTNEEEAERILIALGKEIGPPGKKASGVFFYRSFDGAVKAAAAYSKKNTA